MPRRLRPAPASQFGAGLRPPNLCEATGWPAATCFCVVVVYRVVVVLLLLWWWWCGGDGSCRGLAEASQCENSCSLLGVGVLLLFFL